jgi:hypothetical protein
LAISLPISFLFVIYGSVYGIENFKNIFFSNYNRFYGIGANSLIELIRNQRLTHHKYLPEASIIGGWLVFLVLMFKKHTKNETNLVILSIFSYLIVYIFFGSQPYGWYTFPFWPLLIMLLSIFLTSGIEKGKNLLIKFFISLFILGANISQIINIFEFQPFSNCWRIGVSFIFFIFLLKSIMKSKKSYLGRILLLIMIMAIIYTNLKYLNMIDINFWWQNVS